MGNRVMLYIGTNSDGHLLFVTDKSPGSSLEAHTLVSAESIDSRYEYVRSSGQGLKRDQTTASPGFDEAIGIVKE